MVEEVAVVTIIWADPFDVLEDEELPVPDNELENTVKKKDVPCANVWVISRPLHSY